MKSFKLHINEAKSIYRFIKNNSNLSDTQKRLIDTFFSNNKQASKKFENKYGWQSREPLLLTWEDFREMMGDFKYGRKLLLKSTKIPGKKGTDYWPIRIRETDFIANIPLNWETAQYMNSCRYGTINVNYCIGRNNSKGYWNNHVLNEKKVPVYVVDGVGKWVVMILPDNKNYEVWDKFNNRDLGNIDKEPIPGFNIKRNLIGSRQAKLYDKLREEFYTDGMPPYTEDDLEDAVSEYEELLADIKSDIENEANALRNYEDRNFSVKYKTMKYYEEQIDDIGKDTMIGKIYQKYIDDLDDTPPDKDEMEYITDEINKKYPEADIKLQDELYDLDIYYEYSTPKFDTLSYYDILLHVLSGQNTPVENVQKAEDNIKQKMSEISWELSFESIDWKTAIDDIVEELEKNNIYNPEDNDEYYNY
jgi:hypothetical protein